ncbi:hypothetical protein [Pedobacter panaciterrae]|uniref:hypothetical protein n=1 Tax=Pedobacter panaciterrae TaxID=363849 RepID=UPI00307D49C2
MQLQFNLKKASIKTLLVLSSRNNTVNDLNNRTQHIVLRRALRKSMHEEIKIKCQKDEKFIKFITQIIAEIVKSRGKTEKNVLS